MANYLGIGAGSDEDESEGCREELHVVDGYLRRGKTEVAANIERVSAWAGERMIDLLLGLWEEKKEEMK